MRHPYFDLPLPLVFGHRGASGERPENTLPAFSLALEQGAAILETDVHATRDGVVVVHHDQDLSRTTDGSGPIAAKTWDELRRLDAGYRFTPEGAGDDGPFPFRGQGVRIPTLREVFETFPGVRFNIEIKANDPALIGGAMREIAEAGREKLSLLAAAGDDTMASIRSRLGETGLAVAMGASAGDVVAFVRAAIAGSEPPPEPMALQIPPAFGGRPTVTRELLAFAHDHDVQVHVWTINDPAEMSELLDLGVDGVMSDFPGRLAEVVAARRGGA